VSAAGAVVAGDRQARVAARIDSVVLAAARFWMWPLLLLGIIYTGLPLLAPVLATHGHTLLARGIYDVYRLVCHQRADRSFHLDGQKMAFCERDLAIYGTATLLLLCYTVARPRWRPRSISARAMLLLALPMALDGGTQLLGLRESTWELRVLTGACFSVGVSLFALPYLDQGFADVASAIRARQALTTRS
jgi:uncharacterized membrane protein